MASYGAASAAVTVDLAAGRSSGAEGNDTLVGIENVVGGNFNDSLLGDAGANSLTGGLGEDTWGGGNGNDSMTGRRGSESEAWGGGTADRRSIAPVRGVDAGGVGSRTIG